MKICIYGAGAIGGWLGFKLKKSGLDVSLIARGPHGQAIQQNGLTLNSGGENETIDIPCTDDPRILGPQDIVIVTLKAHCVPAVADKIPLLFNDDTAVVMAVNGLPWWYFYKCAGAHDNARLESADPGGAQWRHITPQRAIGCVVYAASEITAPGIITHKQGRRLSLGEPSGEETPRLAALAEALSNAGLKAPKKTRIRDELWFKLWGNVSFNPVSVLTGETLGQMCTNPDTRKLVHDIMLEAQAVGEAVGAKFLMGLDERIDLAARVENHKTSMLQDFEQGRPMEIDALVTSVQEVARLTGIATPVLDETAEKLKQKARNAGLL